MSKCFELVRKARRSASNLRFAEALTLAGRLGFKHARTKGSRHLLKRPDVAQVINLQPDKRNPGKAKKRQVEQLLVLYDQLGFLEAR